MDSSRQTEQGDLGGNYVMRSIVIYRKCGRRPLIIELPGSLGYTGQDRLGAGGLASCGDGEYLR